MEKIKDPADSIIVCRCENLTLGKLREMLKSGMTSMQEIKKESRCTMGPCQGRTCKELVAREISRYTGIPMDELDIPVSRAPIKPIPLGEIAKRGEADA